MTTIEVTLSEDAFRASLAAIDALPELANRRDLAEKAWRATHEDQYVDDFEAADREVREALQIIREHLPRQTADALAWEYDYNQGYEPDCNGIIEVQVGDMTMFVDHDFGRPRKHETDEPSGD